MPGPPPADMSSRRPALLLVAVAALLGPAGASPQIPPAAVVTATTFVINGRGWGHGVGMSQWGAYGYAKRGVGYRRILAHYYPGTKLAVSPVKQIKVMLIEKGRRIIVSSLDGFRVRDATGALHAVPAGSYSLTPRLKLKLDPAKPPRALPGPLAFLPGKSPLWLAHPYRGSFLVSSNGPTLSVVNVVTLDAYVRGVVSSEMPSEWPLEAVKAQAVAARSYALAHRRSSEFDVFNDARDQVYGGIAAETPVGEAAVAATKREVLLYDGKVATAYFFSSSGGRTATVTDVFLSAKPTPYLVSVPDPYDTASPYHTWGPVPVPAASAAEKLRVPGLDDLQPVPPSGRARSVIAIGKDGEVIVPAGELRNALNLRSTWITVGTLSLSRPAGPVPPGGTATLSGRVQHVDAATLEQREGGGDWHPGPALSTQPDGSFSLAVAVTATTQFRLVAGTIRSAVLTVAVSPPTR